MFLVFCIKGELVNFHNFSLDFNSSPGLFWFTLLPLQKYLLLQCCQPLLNSSGYPLWFKFPIFLLFICKLNCGLCLCSMSRVSYNIEMLIGSYSYINKMDTFPWNIEYIYNNSYQNCTNAGYGFWLISANCRCRQYLELEKVCYLLFLILFQEMQKILSCSAFKLIPMIALLLLNS